MPRGALYIPDCKVRSASVEIRASRTGFNPGHFSVNALTFQLRIADNPPGFDKIFDCEGQSLDQMYIDDATAGLS